MAFFLYLHLFQAKHNLSNERWFLLAWMGVFTLRVSTDWIKRAFPFWKFAFAILSLPRGKLEQSPFYDENSTNNSSPYLPESRMYFKHSLKLFLFLSSHLWNALVSGVFWGWAPFKVLETENLHLFNQYLYYWSRSRESHCHWKPTWTYFYAPENMLRNGIIGLRVWFLKLWA